MKAALVECALVLGLGGIFIFSFGLLTAEVFLFVSAQAVCTVLLLLEPEPCWSPFPDRFQFST
jgi:hypothetical protein